MNFPPGFKSDFPLFKHGYLIPDIMKRICHNDAVQFHIRKYLGFEIQQLEVTLDLGSIFVGNLIAFADHSSGWCCPPEVVGLAPD